jgi:CBS domain-containing protein
MSPSINEIMIDTVVTVDLNNSVFEAAEAMVRDPEATGYVIVLDRGKPLGIVTERDLIHKVMVQKRNPATTTVASIMSTPLITIDPDADFTIAPELMQKHNVSKLVVAKDDILYGVITAEGVAKQCNAYVNQTVREITRWTGLGF